MTGIEFLESNEIPVPPEEVRFREVGVSPYPDGERVRLAVQMTPFLQRPNIEIVVVDEQGEPVASASVIENLEPSLALTLHLRPSRPGARYEAELVLEYPGLGAVDSTKVAFATADRSENPQALS
jgi:hypothetical protein